MPFSVQCNNSFISDWFAASLALSGVFGKIAFLAIWNSFKFHELSANQFSFAVLAHEVVLMPVDSHGLDTFLLKEITI